MFSIEKKYIRKKNKENQKQQQEEAEAFCLSRTMKKGKQKKVPKSYFPI